MWLTQTDRANRAWYTLDLLTLSYSYQIVQNRVVKTFSTHSEFVKRYSDITKRNVEIITSDYVNEHPEVAEQNIALLKNAIELWNTATKTSDAIAPILVHYSWHCFHSFFAYSLFRWDPQYSRSHGISIEIGNPLESTKITFSKKGGLFRRLIDTWTILGASLAFSPLVPILKDNEIHFSKNDMYLLNDSNELSLKELMHFNPTIFEKETISKRQKDLMVCPFIANPISLPNQFLKSYLLLFVASSIARYRPILWHSILRGEGSVKNAFFIDSSEGVLDFAVGKLKGLNLVHQVARIFENIETGKFCYKNKQGSIIK